MGWGSGSGKKEVLNAAVGETVICGSDEAHPFNGKLVFIDLSGLAHRASKKDAMAVVRDGTSLAQQDYVRRQLASVAAEGGTPVLVLDGRAYPPKLATRMERRDAAEVARLEAEQLQQSGKTEEARSKWATAARPQEPFWLALLKECLRTKIQFVVAPYEADAQLVSLAEEYGDRAIIWATSNSDLVAFGGLDVIYDWDPFGRQYRCELGRTCSRLTLQARVGRATLFRAVLFLSLLRVVYFIDFRWCARTGFELAASASTHTQRTPSAHTPRTLALTHITCTH